MSSLQVVKGSHASWCHCVPLCYHEAWASQHHVPPSSHKDRLDAACRWPVGSSQASSLLGLASAPSAPFQDCSRWACATTRGPWGCCSLAGGQKGTSTLALSSRPSSAQSFSHKTGFCSCSAWGRLFASFQFSQPSSQRKSTRGGEAGDKQAFQSLGACPLAGTKRGPVPFCTSTKVAGVKTHHRSMSQFLIPMFSFLRTNHI